MVFAELGECARDDERGSGAAAPAAAEHVAAGLAGRGRAWLYPAGLDSARALPALSGIAGLKIQGFLDRRGGPGVRFRDYLVEVPGRLADPDWDIVVVAHRRSAAELEGGLLASGTPAERIVRLYD